MKFKRLLNTMATLETGMVVSSLFITHTDSWQLHLCIALFCIVSKNYMYD